jgi:electron transport complex protein RnfE
MIKKYLWNNNPALVQMLGLCPLLGVSNSFANSLGLSLATILILTLSNLIISFNQKHINKAIRLPLFVLIIASLTCSVELIMQAYFLDIYNILGLFIPLISTNCIVLGRAEAFAFKNDIKASVIDGFLTATAFSIVLIILGAIREVLGSATLFDGLHLLLGFDWKISFDFIPFTLFILPPGAFLVLAFLVAFKNYINSR